MKAIVLGAGRIGSLIAKDLTRNKDMKVTAVDRLPASLAPLKKAGVTGKTGDLSDPAFVRKAVKDAAVVVNAVPGFLGYETLQTVIEAGRPVVDIAFMPEDSLELDSLARERGVPAVVDMGVAPGMSNLLAGYGVEELDEAEKIRIYVGGLPLHRRLPWEYRIPFSPVDVLEEYTRPARLVVDGQEVVRPALSEVELIDLPRPGTLEAFNTDGLRTLIDTLEVPDMVEKTLRYPGYADKVRLLIDSGFFGTEEVFVGGREVRPFDMTAALLFEAWRLGPDELELTVLRVEVSGTKDGERRLIVFDLYDETDPKTGDTSMARTTGFPAAIVATWLARGRLAEPGVHPPELLGGRSDLVSGLLAELKKRGVSVKKQTVTDPA